MAFIPVPNCAAVDLRWTSNGEFFAENTIYFRNASATPFTLTTLADLSNSIKDGITAADSAALTTTVDGVGVLCRALDSDHAPVYDGGSMDPGGSISSPSLPLSNTFTVKFSTGNAGRSYRGRVYHPVLWEAAVIGNTVSGAVIDDILSFWTTITAQPNDDHSMRHVVVSRFTNNAPRTTGIMTNVIGYTFAGSKVKTQRRRLKHLL